MRDLPAARHSGIRHADLCDGRLRVFVLKVARRPARRASSRRWWAATGHAAADHRGAVAAEARVLRQRRLHARRAWRRCGCPHGVARQLSRRVRQGAVARAGARRRHRRQRARALEGRAGRERRARAGVPVCADAAIRERVSARCAPRFAAGALHRTLGARRRDRCRATWRTSAIATASRSRRSTAACRRSCRTCCRRRRPASSCFGYPSQYTGLQLSGAAAGRSTGTQRQLRRVPHPRAGLRTASRQFLADAARQTGLDPELIAAKLCGRWRNGVPLALSPTQPRRPTCRSSSTTASTTRRRTRLPDAYDDRRGYRCPIGAHIRRMNPRHSTVAGNSGLKRRIVRRGLPYGPPYDPGQSRTTASSAGCWACSSASA